VGVEPLARLKERKLFIPHSGESDKTDRNAEVRYTEALGGGVCPMRLNREQSEKILSEL
jgi:hypothetical protein